MIPKFEALKELQDKNLILHTVWDFKYRGDYAGDKYFHGNCSPKIIENCILRFTEEDDLVVDPMIGSGTTIDVCRMFNRECIGYDIKPVRNDIIQNDSQTLPLDDNSVKMIFLHPPYWNLVYYTKAEENLPDLSRTKTVEDFVNMMRNVLNECFRVLEPKKYLCILIGDLVRNGDFIPLSRYIANLCEEIGFKPSGHAIKLAHGEVSRKKSGVIFAELAYTNNLKISHDNILFFKK